MENKYDEMTESEEEREVAKLSKKEQKQHQEMKDLMTIQGRLKGHVPGFGAGISAYVTGWYPGVPFELVKPYVVEEKGKKADLLTRLPPAEIDSLIQEHDSKIPHQDVVIRPGRKGITMSIDPNSNDEVYEINMLDDSLETVIKLTREKDSEKSITGEKASEAVKTATATEDRPSTATRVTDDRVLVPNVVSQAMADDYTKEEKPEEEDSDAKTISSTSTVDYDREEVEDLLDKISSCHTVLTTHYNKMNKIVPHMTQTQLAQYLGKVHIMNIVKTEGIVSKTYTSELETSETKFLVRGETHEEKLQGLVDTVPAHQLMLAIAIGDIHLKNCHMTRPHKNTNYQKVISKELLVVKRNTRKEGSSTNWKRNEKRILQPQRRQQRKPKWNGNRRKRRRLHNWPSFLNRHHRTSSLTLSMTMMMTLNFQL